MFVFVCVCLCVCVATEASIYFPVSLYVVAMCALLHFCVRVSIHIRMPERKNEVGVAVFMNNCLRFCIVSHFLSPSLVGGVGKKSRKRVTWGKPSLARFNLKHASAGRVGWFFCLLCRSINNISFSITLKLKQLNEFLSLC